MSSDKKPKTVVICGGGIIGCAVAYYLTSLEPELFKCVIVECEEIACHSSGKAGGFLSLDWNDHSSAIGPLARLSFDLHKELSQILKDETGIDVGYRTLNTFSISANNNNSNNSNSKKSSAIKSSWIDGNVTSKEKIGNTQTTAQVNPYLLTKALFQSAVQKGATLVIDKVIDVECDEKIDENNTTASESYVVKKVILENKPALNADIVVIAMGAWSGMAKNFFPNCTSFPNIRGNRAHSIVIDSVEVPPEAMFVQYRNNKKTGEEALKEPEIYPRPPDSIHEGYTVYICGEGDDEPLPDNPALVVPKLEACNNLYEMACDLSSTLKNGKVLKQSACFLPCSDSGKPIIGKIPKYEGAYIATGHGCWGILNGPATGKCLAQYILNKKVDIDLKGLVC